MTPSDAATPRPGPSGDADRDRAGRGSRDDPDAVVTEAPDLTLDEREPMPAALPAMTRLVRHGFRAEPKLLIASLAMTILEAIPDVLVAVWLAMLTSGIIDGDRDQLLLGALGLAGSAAASWALQVTLGRTKRRLGDRLNIHFQTMVAALQARIPGLEHHERPDYQDRIAVLRTGVFALDHLFASMFTMVGWLARLIAVMILLASADPRLTLLAVAALPLLAVALWRPGVEKAAEESVASRGRLGRHLFVVATTPGPAKEVRVTGNGPDLRRRRAEAWGAWFAPQRDAALGTAGWLSLAWAFFAAAFVVALAWVASRPGIGAPTVVLVVAAGGRLSAYVGSAVGELGFLRGIWLDSARRLAWLEDLADRPFGAGRPVTPQHRQGRPMPDELTGGIDLVDVSFRYPGSRPLVLDRVSLHLPAGSVVAVVGENGAGKSTLVKLLARMYQPTAGRITADGVDISAYDIGQWRERIGGAFQDFARLEFRAITTVGLGDPPHRDDRAAVASATDRAGAETVLDVLPDGLDTQLGPSWDGGVDVSFGQWQKLALARGYMRPEPILLLLDEPTAALDAETEHALFERFAGGARAASGNGRVTVLVSHRFSTVRMADLIVVLDGARVAETGSHDELMARGGLYSDLYTIQARSYG